MTAPLFALAALVLAAPAVAGQTPDSLRDAVFKAPPGAARSELPRGVARTSVQARFDRDRMTGDLGYLCGRKADLATAGAAGARGVDHDGRFLGVKLSLSLK